MKKEEIYLSDPPRLLLGAAAIFWGGMSGHALVGLLMALALEARHWVSSRWDFGEKGFVRAWQLSVVLGFVVGFVMRFQFSPPANFLDIFTWIPVFLLPVMLASIYSAKLGIPVTTFSYFARRKMLQERAEGWDSPAGRIFLGYPFLGILVIMAGLGLRDVIWYGSGAALLLLAGVYFAWPNGRRRPGAWVFAAFISVAMAVVIASVINTMYYYLLDGGWYKELDRGSALESTTFLGRVGQIKLSPKIRWRVIVEEGPRPDLLRSASYSLFGLNSWISAGEVADRRRGNGEKLRQRATALDFTGLFLEKSQNAQGSRFSFQKTDLKKTQSVHSRYRLRGELTDEDLIPLDLDARTLDEFSAKGVEYNVMGTTRVIEPGHLVSDLVVESSDSPVSDDDPFLSDLQLSRQRDDRRNYRSELRKGLKDFLRDSGLKVPEIDAMDMEKDVIEQRVMFARLKQVFQRDFHYSLNQNAIPQKFQNKDVIAYFLNEGKTGHCEYFATATTLLLREMGVPTRYSVGFAVVESGNSKNEFVLRGTHAHAWCRAYLGGNWVEELTPEGKKEWRCRGGEWIDLDTTPAVWVLEDQADMTWARRVLDWWQTWQENFAVWRSQAANRLIINGLLIAVGLILTIYILARLRSTRTRKEKSTKENKKLIYARVGTAISQLESQLQKILGPRPRGLTMGDWLQRASQEIPELTDEMNIAREIYQRVRFDSKNSTLNDAQALETSVEKLRPALEKAQKLRDNGWWSDLMRVLKRPIW